MVQVGPSCDRLILMGQDDPDPEDDKELHVSDIMPMERKAMQFLCQSCSLQILVKSFPSSKGTD